MKPKARSVTENNGKLNFPKIEYVMLPMTTLKNEKIKHTLEKMLTSYISNKELVSRKYKELL